MSHRRLSQRRAWLAALSASTLAVGLAAAVAVPRADAASAGRHLSSVDRTAPQGQEDGVGPRALSAAHGRQAYLVRLAVPSTTQTFAANRAGGVVGARLAARRQLAKVTVAQNRAIAALPAGSHVLYRTHAALAGFAVTTDASHETALSRISGVRKVYPIAAKSVSNSYAIPLQGGPEAWHQDAYGGGASVAVIDTGIDFTHADFGGAGTPEAYNTEHEHADDATLWPGSSFPSTKVVGGYDFVGDAYNADDPSSVPVEDPNPLDCEGHGSHVAGTVAGLGVTKDGKTYDGTYSSDTDVASMRIGPGMAPVADLYAYRVFGCEGTTNVVGAAIDRAMDPDNNGDPSDHVDVVNMSLGSDFGSPDDGDAVMADEASLAGVTMAISSGNSSDLYDVGGSPGTAVRAITAAASIDAQSVVDGLDVNVDGDPAQDSPYAAERSAAYDWSADPDLSGQVVDIGADATGCNSLPFTDEQKEKINGNIVILKWTQENLECGSVQRSGNVVAAGGIGFILANSAESFSAGITGSAVIPGVLVSKSGGEAIRAAIGGGSTVTISGTEANAVSQQFPADNDTLTDFTSRGIRAAGNVKPDVTAVGATVFSAAVTTGADGVTESGTSMASPMVAGLAADIKSVHPSWTPEQVKADIMNTAGQNLYTGTDHTGDRYAPNRIGSGRIQADVAATNQTLAYVGDGSGAVSVSFGPVAVTGPVQMAKTVTVENTSGTEQTYAVGYDEITSVPGVSYEMTPSSVTVPAGGSQDVTVTLKVTNAALLTKTVDETHGRYDSDGYALQTLADASGNLTLTPQDHSLATLRVPVYSAPRPASQMGQGSSLNILPSSSTAALSLFGLGVDQGADAENVSSLGAGFELGAPQSGVLPACADAEDDLCASTVADKAADLEYLGVTSDAPYVSDAGNAMAYFAITTHGPHATAAGETEYDVYLDTDGNGAADLIAYNSRATDEDLMLTKLVDAATGDLLDAEYTNVLPGDIDTATYDSDVIVQPVWLTALADYGVDADSPRVNYGVVSYSSSRIAPVDAINVDPDTGDVGDAVSADLFTPAITVTDATDPSVIFNDQSGTALTVTRDADSYAADGGQGLLMVHFHNVVGSKAQVVSLTANQQSSSVSLSAPSKVKVKKTVKVTVTVKTKAGVVPTGKVTIKTTSGKKLGTGTLKKGKATVSFKAPSKPGKLKIKAGYAGDATYSAGSSSTKTITVTK